MSKIEMNRKIFINYVSNIIHFFKPYPLAVFFSTLLLWGNVQLILASGDGDIQKIPRNKIEGKVYDAETGEPLHYVNVFLSNTTLGCATSSNGSFVIENVPVGNYEIVVSMIGYTVQRKKIWLSKERPEMFVFRLKPEAIKIPGIEVTAPVPSKWKKNLKEFEKHFLGESRYADQCRILNPELLNFNYDEEKDIFSATASGPIRIDNKALGYEIIFHLRDFRLTNGVVSYLGDAYFKEYEAANEDEKKTWQKNRRTVYRGSLKHFLSSLSSERLSDNDFLVYMMSDLPKTKAHIVPVKIDPEILVTQAGNIFEKKISFDGYLKIVSLCAERNVQDSNKDLSYEIVQSRFSTHAGRRRGKNQWEFPESWLRMNVLSTRVNWMGFAENPYAFTIYGAWAMQRMAEELPNDYIMF